MMSIPAAPFTFLFTSICFYLSRATLTTCWIWAPSWVARPQQVSLSSAFLQVARPRLMRTYASSPSSPSDVVLPGEFSDDDIRIVEDLYQRGIDSDIGKVLLESLPTLPAQLVVRLRQAGSHSNGAISAVSQALHRLLDERLVAAKETLQELLNAGEIRKLDAMIGQASRDGQLDVAFFNVLSMNLKDAAAAAEQQQAGSAGEAGEGMATRLQILQHVYTRCQEEVEKSLPPATALFNKLLRTEQESIRSNLYRHYLTPPPNVISTPDGRTVQLSGNPSSVLVPLEQFIQAVAEAVLQIRTVEKSGGTSREAAASMVEMCRQVAKEARFVIAECYGLESPQLSLLEEGLQPVFRPPSPTSPYIQGQS